MDRETNQKLDEIKKNIIRQLFTLPLSEKIKAYGDLSTWCVEGMLFEYGREFEEGGYK